MEQMISASFGDIRLCQNVKAVCFFFFFFDEKSVVSKIQKKLLLIFFVIILNLKCIDTRLHTLNSSKVQPQVLTQVLFYFRKRNVTVSFYPHPLFIFQLFKIIQHSF